jgi:hypothetical protein
MFKESKTRPILLWNIDITGCKESKDVYQRVLERVENHIRSEAVAEKPIVSISYVGKVEFSTLQIDNEFIRTEVEKRTNSLICEIKDGSNVLSASGQVAVLPSRNEIEKDEIGKMIDLYPEYKRHKDLITNLVLSFKSKALTGADDEDLLELILNSIPEEK